MTSEAPPIEDKLKELDDLLRLAEESAAILDRLRDQIERAKISVWVFLLLAVAFPVISYGWPFAVGTSGTRGLSSSPLTLVLAGLFALTWLASLRMDRLRKLQREESAEREIKDRLVSMIDEQIRRVRSTGLQSPVAEATLDIRLRRLNRSDRK